MEKIDIVVTGIGIYTSVGNDRHDFWESLTKGISGAGPITAFDTTGYKSRIGAEIKDFHPEEYLSKKRIRRMSRFTRTEAKFGSRTRPSL